MEPIGTTGLSSPKSRARRGTGLLMAVVSAATFGSSGTFGSALLRTGWSPGAVVLARIIVAAIVLTPSAVVQLRGRWKRLRRSAGMVIAYGLIGVVGCQLPFFLRDPEPANRGSSAAGVHGRGLVHAMPLAASTRDVTFLSHRTTWVAPVIGIGVLATAPGYTTGIAAVRYLGPKLASFIGMSEVLFAAIFAWAALAQVPSGAQFAGGAFILAGVALVRADEPRLS